MNIKTYRREVIDAINGVDMAYIEQAAVAMDCARCLGGWVYTCGNGGSAATASHLAGDLSKGCSIPDKAQFKTHCLSDSIPTLTAVANDVRYRSVFVNQLRHRIGTADVVVAISGSGNSPNVLYAVGYASSVGAVTIGLSGFDGGMLAKAVDIPIIVPCNNMEQVEDVHMVICHMMKVRLLEMVNA